MATIANVTTLAVDLGVPPFGEAQGALTVAVLATAALIAARMLWSRRDTLYAVVVAWAFPGIALKRSGAPGEGSALVAGAALVGLVAFGVGVLAVAGRARLGGS